MNKIVKNALILTLITLVSGICLGFVYEITKKPIAVSKENAKQEAYQSVLKEAEQFDAYQAFDKKEAAKAVSDIPGCTVDEVAEAKSKGEVVGYVVTTTSSEGYGGNIQISIGITKDGVVEGIEILSINETAGLGMKATETEFREQYVGKSVEQFKVTKTGASSDEEIDAISGATITSNAVTNAVNAGLTYFNQVIGGSANE